MTVEMNGFIFSDDKERLQIENIFHLLHSSYWAKSRTREIIEKSIQNSLCFGVYFKEKQIGFARCVTDYATLFYLADVIIEEKYKGQGLGKALLEIILNHEELKNCNSILRTADAQNFYTKFNYTVINNEYMYRKNTTITMTEE